MTRRQNFQTISWFHDIQNRSLLDLDPPYQRRSVWNQSFKDYFIDTVLLNYPAPALFLYEDITADGRSMYHVIDGKQRLTTIFEFIRGEFPVADSSELTNLRDQYFSSLDETTRKQFWAYQFLVEYVPADDEKLINGIFDRINRNVAKLTPQELRHAKLDGVFITAAEDLAEWLEQTLPKSFPRFAHQSKKQMKDVEFVALLLLLIEEGPQGYSQADLDTAFTNRDQSWEERFEVEARFRSAIESIHAFLKTPIAEQADLTSSRLRNQADFYSLVGALVALDRDRALASPEVIAAQLADFAKRADDPSGPDGDPELAAYLDAARSASNDKGPRETRISYLKKVLTGGAA